MNNYKVVFLGSCGVGKSSIVRRYTRDIFNQHSDSTIGAAFSSKIVENISGRPVSNIQLNIWDTAGQERFESLMPMYYRDTDIAFVVFDMTEPSTFNKAKEWVDKLLKETSKPVDEYNPHIILVGNKIDSNMCNSNIFDQASTYAEMKDLKFYTVSAKSGSGIFDMFEDVTSHRLDTDNREIEPKQKIELKPSPMYMNIGSSCFGIVDYLNPMYLINGMTAMTGMSDKTGSPLKEEDNNIN